MPLATHVNAVAGYLLATADKLYVVRQKQEAQLGASIQG